MTNQEKPRRNRGQSRALTLTAGLSPVEVSRWSPAEALERLHTSSRGLSEGDAAGRLKEFGRNELATHGKRNSLAMFAGNFVHLLALLLWIAAFLAFVGGLPELGWAILAVILINGIFSFAQEYRAGQLLEALQRQVRASSAVRRDGVVRTIDAALLSPGRCRRAGGGRPGARGLPSAGGGRAGSG